MSIFTLPASCVECSTVILSVHTHIYIYIYEHINIYTIYDYINNILLTFKASGVLKPVSSTIKLYVRENTNPNEGKQRETVLVTNRTPQTDRVNSYWREVQSSVRRRNIVTAARAMGRSSSLSKTRRENKTEGYNARARAFAYICTNTCTHVGNIKCIHYMEFYSEQHYTENFTKA